MKAILAVFIVVIAIFVSAVFFLFQPKNLGITYTDADLKSVYEKIKVKYEPLPKEMKGGKAILVAGSHPVDVTFSSAELTALADNRRKNFALFPFRKVQLKINPDGTVEGSAVINYTDAVNYLVAMGVAHDDIVKAAAKFKVPPVDLPVMMKASGKIVDNASEIVVASATIANIPVPQGLVNQYGPSVNDLVENIIKERQSSYNFERLEVVQGLLHFKGTSPDVEMAVK